MKKNESNEALLTVCQHILQTQPVLDLQTMNLMQNIRAMRSTYNLLQWEPALLILSNLQALLLCVHILQTRPPPPPEENAVYQ